MNEDELKEENAELYADYEALADEHTKLRDQNARLKAEVERLTFDPLTYLDDTGEWMPRHTHLAAVERLKAQVEAYEVASIHTCSRGCQKKGCPRKYLDEIADLKAEVHRLEEIVGSDAIDRKYGMCCDASDEVTRLKAEVERLTAFTTRTIIPNEELQAQVERLTKAGDEMASILMDGGVILSGYLLAEDWFKAKWHAAKEGKQP